MMVRMMHHLQQEGHRCAVLDMTRIGSDDVTPAQWYKGLAIELWQALLGQPNLFLIGSVLLGEGHAKHGTVTGHGRVYRRLDTVIAQG